MATAAIRDDPHGWSAKEDKMLRVPTAAQTFQRG